MANGLEGVVEIGASMYAPNYCPARDPRVTHEIGNHLPGILPEGYAKKSSDPDYVGERMKQAVELFRTNYQD